MNGYKIKPTFEPNDKYEKAKKDVIQAAISVQELTPQQCQELAQELFGYEMAMQLFKIIQQCNERGKYF